MAKTAIAGQLQSADDLSPSDKIRVGVPLTSEDAASILAKPVLDKYEAGWVTGLGERWMVREGHAKHRLPGFTPPDSNQLRWRRSTIDRYMDEWEADAQGDSPKPRARDPRTTRKAKSG